MNEKAGIICHSKQESSNFCLTEIVLEGPWYQQDGQVSRSSYSQEVPWPPGRSDWCDKEYKKYKETHLGTALERNPFGCAFYAQGKGPEPQDTMSLTESVQVSRPQGTDYTSTSCSSPQPGHMSLPVTQSNLFSKMFTW
ncbi:uncharacterized protein RBU33_019036 [Hipposideros larvatus]